MLNTAENKEFEENQNFGLKTLQVLEQLEKEAQELNEEKMSLLDMQERLWLKVSGEIENRKTRNEKLRMEIKELREKCNELTRVLNSWPAGQ